MAFKDVLEKVYDVAERIVYGNKDISKLEAKRQVIHTFPKAHSSMCLDTDRGDHVISKVSSENPEIATVDEDGVVTAHALGTTTVSLTSGKFTTSATVNVGEPIIDRSTIPQQDRIIDEIIIVNPKETLSVGDEFVLYAIGVSNTMTPKYDISYYNPIKWSSSDPSIAIVTYGTLVANKEGVCTITASDLNENASASFTLTVTAKQVMPEVSFIDTYFPTLDNTGETDVTVEIADVFAYAVAHNFKKISFATGKYKMNGDNRPNDEAIVIPSNMVIDFNGSEIHFEAGEKVLSGYPMFAINDTVNTWLVNLTIFGENYGREQLLRVERNRSLVINGNSKNVHIENCRFAWSPGFNVNITSRWNHPYEACWLRLNNVEPGGLDDNGQPIDAGPGVWRSINYFGGSERGHGHDHDGYTIPRNTWAFGNYQNNKAAKIRSRLYDIYFYDSDYNLLYCRKNCFMYQKYTLPENYNHFCYKVVFYQENAPTSEENEWGMAWLIYHESPEDIYFTKCTFDNNVSTGLSPQGGIHVVIDKCKFIDNGIKDPTSHIDWEDGRQTSQGHIVKNSFFDKNPKTYHSYSQIINDSSRCVSFHDNYVRNGSFSSRSESLMQRCFNNYFENNNVSIVDKCDNVFANNIVTKSFSKKDPQAYAPDGETWYTHTILIDNELPNNE